jgi:hypothetical protein
MLSQYVAWAMTHAFVPIYAKDLAYRLLDSAC